MQFAHPRRNFRLQKLKRKQTEPQGLHVISKTVVSGGHLPEQVLVEGFCKATIYVWTFFVGKSFFIDERNV